MQLPHLQLHFDENYRGHNEHDQDNYTLQNIVKLLSPVLVNQRWNQDQQARSAKCDEYCLSDHFLLAHILHTVVLSIHEGQPQVQMIHRQGDESVDGYVEGANEKE